MTREAIYMKESDFVPLKAKSSTLQYIMCPIIPPKSKDELDEGEKTGKILIKILIEEF